MQQLIDFTAMTEYTVPDKYTIERTIKIPGELCDRMYLNDGLMIRARTTIAGDVIVLRHKIHRNGSIETTGRKYGKHKDIQSLINELLR
jgi:hypothetical protein